ncbi:MAG: extracellular solute-binding protein, partial [Actinomycetota bacterium]|nr:extracellular solute-binding protein [Actinomycetota bacterium]
AGRVVAGEETDDEAADDSDGADEGAADAGLEELVAAAQEEGSLVWYSVPAEEIAQSISDGFSDEYGIDVEFQRLASRDLSQRYAAEVDAGDTVADALFVSNTPFVSEAMGNGWTTPLADAGIPGYPGDYPAEFVLDDRGTTIASIEPSGIAYNTDQVGEDEVPTDWAELAGPEWEGRILLTDPAASPAYVDFWSVVLDAQGPEVLEGIAANTIRTYPSGVPTTEALAAGEGAVAIPGVGSIVAGAAERGAPVAYSQPDLTTGPELVVLVSADAPHPNAARLFAWYLLFGEGEALANALPTTASPLTGEDLPPEYTRVSPDAQQRADEILGLLGAG